MTTVTDFAVGDIVQPKNSNQTGLNSGGYNSTLDKDEVFKITRVYKDRYTIRRLTPQRYVYNSFNVGKTAVVVSSVPADPSTVPDGKIGPDHPDIQWLWERAAKIASDAGHCSEYDKIAESLGIPGRVRSFTVKADHNGITVSAKIKARSRVEAEKKFKETLAK